MSLILPRSRVRELTLTAILVPMAAVACSAETSTADAPQERSATQSAELSLRIPHCAANQVVQCSSEITPTVCQCIDNTCDPANDLPDFHHRYGPGAVLELAWAATNANNTCPVLPGIQGRWAQIAPATSNWDGVPTSDYVWAPDCAEVFPGKISGSTCCTYVWWPDGYIDSSSKPPAGGWSPQDQSAMCPDNLVQRARMVDDELDIEHKTAGCADCCRNCK